MKNVTSTIENYKGNFYIQIPTDKIINNSAVSSLMNDLSYSILHVEPGITTYHLSLTNALKSIVELQKEEVQMPFKFMGDNNSVFIIQEEGGKLISGRSKINIEAPGSLREYPEVDTVIAFIRSYRQLENARMETAYKFIMEIFAHKSYCAHLCNSWEGKESDFGSFYLNLSYEAQILILNHWQLKSEEDLAYINLVKDEGMQTMYINPPFRVKLFNNLILFFNNHGIKVGQISKGVVVTIAPQDFDKCYGNSANWGDYILSLPENEQESLINSIFKNYNTNSLFN